MLALDIVQVGNLALRVHQSFYHVSIIEPVRTEEDFSEVRVALITFHLQTTLDESSYTNTAARHIYNCHKEGTAAQVVL